MDKMDAFLKEYSNFPSSIQDSAIIVKEKQEEEKEEEEKDHDTMMTMLFNRHEDKLSEFLTFHCSRNNTSQLDFYTVYESDSSSNHKWEFKLAWESVSRNPIIRCQLVLNDQEMFQTFTIQKNQTYSHHVDLAMHFAACYRNPADLKQFDFLVWAGQICLTCLIDLLSSRFNEKEMAQLKHNGFTDWPMTAILKSSSLFSTEYVIPQKCDSSTKKQKIMKELNSAMGFVYRPQNHYKDWELKI